MHQPPPSAHVAVASLNQTVGDWSGNAARVRAVLNEARARGVRLVGLPELAISGYSLGDRVFMRGTLERSWQALLDVLPATYGLIACVGLPIRHRGVLYNAIAVVADGVIHGLAVKEHLAVGDVQYESRWYSGWTHGVVETYVSPDGQALPIGTLLFAAEGIGRFAVEVCEDGWKGLRPSSVYALAGAHIVLNPSASWFVLGKHARRRRICQQVSAEDYTAYLYSSLLGCDATRVIFDGSVFIAAAGDVLQEGRRFRFAHDHELIDAIIDVEALAAARSEEGSWRAQVEALHRGAYGPIPQVVTVPGDFSTVNPAPAPEPYWVPRSVELDPSLSWLAAEGRVPRAPTALDLPHLELELALCLGLSEYVRKSHIRGITLALSGGRDSSMCALLVHRMHHYDTGLTGDALRAHVRARFATAYLATAHSGGATREAARLLADEVGAEHHESEMQAAVDTHLDLTAAMMGLRPSWSDPAHDIALQNVQARLRGSLVWMLANLKGHLLLTTSNLSEAAVGYATMDGDTSGGIAPLADVPKSLIQLWLAWAADFHGVASLGAVLHTPATAELRPPGSGQTDEDDLMPFDVLDRLVYHFVQLGQEPAEMFRALWPSFGPRYSGDPTAFAAHIRKFVTLFCRAQWKRERLAIGFRVTAFDLDPKTGFRFPPVQAPFTEELAALDAAVATLR